MLTTRNDSRSVRSGDHFIAVSDCVETRREHMADARARGALAISAEDVEADIFCGHARYAWARLHAAASGADAVKTPLIGITGTDGKTTCSFLLQHAMGQGAARIGTLGMDDGKRVIPSGLTTPAAEDVHDFITTLPANCPGVAIEISSHAAEQERLAGLQLSALIFTGLGHDHLDYHQTRERYLQAKLRAVRLLPAGSLCVINADDELAHLIRHAVLCVGGRCVSIGRTRGDIRLFQESSADTQGLSRWRLESTYADYPLHLPMIGYHNAWNAAASALALESLGIPLSSALALFSDAPIVPGRLEQCSTKPLCFVDYAHTAQALDTVQKALRQEFPNKKLITVFGCGGDRDHDKRAAMGTIAATAKSIIVCNDNPRSEDPMTIAREICGEHACAADAAGLDDEHRFLIELDREQAIRTAFALADEETVILVAGKGHETKQIIGQQAYDWDDRAFIRSLSEQCS